MGFPWRDGRGWRPDSWVEAVVWVGALIGVSLALVFTGLDAQVEYALTAPGQYLLSSADSEEQAVFFGEESIELMNAASKNSLGSDSIGAERGYCGGVVEGYVTDFRLADIIKSSDRTSITFACGDPFEISVHSQPDGSKMLSEEDRDMTGEALVDYTCIQYAEISVSPVSGRLDGINCWEVVEPSEEFRRVSAVVK